MLHCLENGCTAPYLTVSLHSNHFHAVVGGQRTRNMGSSQPVVVGFFWRLLLLLSLRVISHVLHVEAEVQTPFLHAPRELEVVVLPPHRAYLCQGSVHLDFMHLYL